MPATASTVSFIVTTDSYAISRNYIALEIDLWFGPTKYMT
jgi:hypothetical protein